MRRALAMMAVCVALAGCGDAGDDSRVSVTPMTTRDGCTVYRFEDRYGVWRYYMACEGRTTVAIEVP